jgi:hypothetical protein
MDHKLNAWPVCKHILITASVLSLADMLIHQEMGTNNLGIKFIVKALSFHLRPH